MSMTLTKRITGNINIITDKLDRLKQEDFGRVLVPKFDYKVVDNDIVLEVEYIKGYAMGSASLYRKIILDDVVNRDNDWTFDDYDFSNFVIARYHKGIYAVDLLSYRYWPDKIQRQSAWAKARQDNRSIIKSILHHEFFPPQGS